MDEEPSKYSLVDKTHRLITEFAFAASLFLYVREPARADIERRALLETLARESQNPLAAQMINYLGEENWLDR